MAGLGLALAVARTPVLGQAIAAERLPLMRAFRLVPEGMRILERRCYEQDTSELLRRLPGAWAEGPHEVLLAFHDSGERTRYWDSVGAFPEACANAIEIYRVG